MIITCNINEETFKINYSGKFILVDYKNYLIKHAEDFYLDLKYDGDKMIDLYIFNNCQVTCNIFSSLL